MLLNQNVKFISNNLSYKSDSLEDNACILKIKTLKNFESFSKFLQNSCFFTYVETEIFKTILNLNVFQNILLKTYKSDKFVQNKFTKYFQICLKSTMFEKILLIYT